MNMTANSSTTFCLLCISKLDCIVLIQSNRKSSNMLIHSSQTSSVSVQQSQTMLHPISRACRSNMLEAHNPAGILPRMPAFPCNERLSNSTNNSSSAGNLPPNALFARSRAFNCTRLPSCDGIMPVNELSYSLRCSRFVRSPNSVGIDLLKEFWDRSIITRPDNWPNAVGIGPSKPQSPISK